MYNVLPTAHAVDQNYYRLSQFTSHYLFRHLRLFSECKQRIYDTITFIIPISYLTNMNGYTMINYGNISLLKIPLYSVFVTF